MKLWQVLPLAAGLVALPAQAYQVSGAKWPDGKFILNVGVPGTSPTGFVWNNEIATSLQAWDRGISGLTLDAEPLTSDPCEGYTAVATATDPTRDTTTALVNGIGFSADLCGIEFGEDVVAVTLTQTSGAQPGTMIEADIIFNSNQQFDTYTGAYNLISFDLRRVVMHEIGHAIGLAHENNLPAIMHANAYRRNVLTPTADDLAGGNVLYPVVVNNDPPLRMALEEPGEGQIKSGISNIRGWAIGLEEIRLVEMSIDGGPFKVVPHGGKRADVADAYSTYPGAGSSGYSMIYNWGSLSNGQHHMTIRMHDVFDRAIAINRDFEVTGFDSAFYNSNTNVAINGSSSITEQKDIHVNGVDIGASRYDVQLRWDNAAQRFIIVNVSK